jgi:hypothetical protein
MCSVADITGSSLNENSAWVDQRLEELYYGYGLTSDNCDDYIDAGLLVERWSWLDEALQAQYDSEFDDTLDQYILCPAGLSWVLYKNYDAQHCLEEESRSRAESDISDYAEAVDGVLKHLECHSPLPLLPSPIDYSYLYAVSDEIVDVDNDDDFENMSSISFESVLFDASDIDDGYDSF